jgi:hypothetical protein
MRGPEVSLGSFKGPYYTRAIAYAAYAAASSIRYISHGPYLPNDLRNRRNQARGGYSSRPLRYTSIGHDLPQISIQSSLESPKHRRMRSRRLPDPRPIQEGVREPIYIRKK